MKTLSFNEIVLSKISFSFNKLLSGLYQIKFLLVFLISLLYSFTLLGQVTVFEEDFSGGSMPTGWTTGGTGSWTVSNNYSCYEASGISGYSVGCCGSSAKNSNLISPTIDLSAYTDVSLSFYHRFRRSNYGGSETGTLFYSTDGGSTWTQINQWTSSVGPTTYTIDLSSELDEQSNVKLKWNFSSAAYNYFWAIDDIEITGNLSASPFLELSSLSSFGDVCINTTDGPNSFTITGSNLTAENITVGSLNGFTFSTTSSGSYSSSLSLAQGGGAYSQTIYVKFSPSNIQSYNGNIVVGGGGASSVNCAVVGSGVNSAPAVAVGSASDIMPSTATVSGSISNIGCSSITAYGIEYSTTNGFANGSGTQVASSNLSGGNFSSQLSSLSPGTTYYFKSYATNSGGTSYSSQSSFTSGCGAETFPYSESFETYSTNYGSVISQNSCYVGGGSGTWNVFHGAPNSGSNSAYFSWSNKPWLFIPVYLEEDAVYSFSAHASTPSGGYGPAYITVKYGTTATAGGMTSGTIITETEIPSENGYTELLNTFIAPSTGLFYIGIFGETKTSTSSSRYLDDIVIDKIACAIPTSLTYSAVTQTTATISWTAASPAPSNGYQYYYSTSSVAPSELTAPSGTVGAGVTSANLSSLTANTRYYFWVRSNCGGGDLSNWVGSQTFRTECGAAGIPFVESFEDGFTNETAIEGCYFQEHVSGTVRDWNAYNSNAQQGSWSASLYHSSQRWLFMPVQLEAGKRYVISLYALGTGTLSLKYGSSYGDANMTVGIITNQALTGSYTQYSGIIEPSTTGDYYIGILGNNTSAVGYLRIDNLVIRDNVQWTGTSSNEWNTANNWNLGFVPSSIDNVLITNTYSNELIINQSKASPAVCNNLQINSTASITVNPDKALTINGNLMNNGTLNLKSTVAGDASLIVNGNISGSGTNNVERYISANKWHLVSPPVTGAKANVFQDIWLRPYDEQTNDFGEYISNSNTNLVLGQGYSVWTNSSETRTFTGSLNNSSVTKTLQRSPDGGSPLSQGWNLIGNPFASAIDLNSASGWTTNNVGNAVYIWDGNYSGGQYRVALSSGFGSDIGIAVNGGSQYIALGQGFFVQATSNGATISMDKDIQVHNSIAFRNKNTIPDLLSINISGNSASDETVIYFNQFSNSNYDFTYDAAKLYGSAEAPQLYSKKNDEMTAIQSINDKNQIFGKKLYLEVGVEAEYTINYSHTFTDFNNIGIKDLITGIIFNPNENYEFIAQPEDETARFEIVSRDLANIDEDIRDEILVWNHNNYLNVKIPSNEKLQEIWIYNIQGSLILKSNSFVTDLNSFSKAMYIVHIHTDRQVITEKIIIK